MCGDCHSSQRMGVHDALGIITTHVYRGMNCEACDIDFGVGVLSEGVPFGIHDDRFDAVISSNIRP